jgi:O-antigen ligase
MLGLAAAAVWLALGRRWRFGATLLGAGAAASIVILAVAFVTHTPWKKTPLYEPYESVMSIVDVTGQRIYEGKDTSSKGDNNLFRRVWWQAVLEETIEGNPSFGLGFGYDLADRFVREYYPEDSEEFSARSPHNFLLTIFARMGAVGLALFQAVLGVVAVRTWRAVRAGPELAAPWCAAWAIFTSACFGVVLEGPMGAVVFWTLLGVADASRAAASFTAAPDPGEKPAEPALPSATASV